MVKTRETAGGSTESEGLAASAGNEQEGAAANARMPAHHNLSAKVFRQAERAEDRFLKQQKTTD